MAGFQLADNKGVRGILFFPSSSSLRTLLMGAQGEGIGYEKRTPANLDEVRRRSGKSKLYCLFFVILLYLP